MKRFHLSVDEVSARLAAFAGGTMSEYPFNWKPDTKGAYPQYYWERIARKAVEFEPKTVLMVGGALGTIPMMMRRLGCAAYITVLEPDAVIAAIGKGFGLGKQFTDIVSTKTLEKLKHDLDKGYATPQMSTFADGTLGYDVCIVDAFTFDGDIGEDWGVYNDKKAFLKEFGKNFKHIIANPSPGGRCEVWK